MDTPDSHACPSCGAPIPAASGERLCPACLLSQALVGPDDATLVDEPASHRRHDAVLPEPADFPCTFGGYRLDGMLGRGGMGAVYEAEDLATGRRLALKMLSMQLNSPEMRKRFLREGRLAASVSHPNSLYIFGTEEIEGGQKKVDGVSIPMTMEMSIGGQTIMTMNFEQVTHGMEVDDTLFAVPTE